MKRGWKIFFIVLAIVIVAILIFAYITYKQATGILSLASSDSINSLQTDFISLMSGDCSKLAIVEAKIADIKSKVNSACSNPILRIAIEKKAPQNICNKEVFANFTAQSDSAISLFRKQCS